MKNEIKSLTSIDYTNFDIVEERIKDNPEQALKNMNLNDFRLAALIANEDVYSRLMEIFDKNKEARELLFTYSHLSFCHYDIESVVLSDIDESKKLICNIFTPELKAKKAKERENILSSLSPKIRKMAEKKGL